MTKSILLWLSGLGATLLSLGLLATPQPGSTLPPAIRDRVDALSDLRATRFDPASPFDRVLGSLEAGLGVDTPATMESALNRIHRGRDNERRKPDTQSPDIERGLAELNALLDVGQSSASSAPPLSTLLLGMFGLIAVSSSLVRLHLRLRALERERATLAHLIGASRSDAGLGDLIRDKIYRARLLEIRLEAMAHTPQQPRVRANPPGMTPDLDTAANAIDIPAILFAPPPQDL